MSDQRFFDLAVKIITHQAIEAERAEFDALLESEPKLWAEFSRLQEDARMAKAALPLVAACTASTGEFPAYARERLQTTVRQTLGRPESAAKEPAGRLIPARQFMPASDASAFGREVAPRRASNTGQPAAMQPHWGRRSVLGLAAAAAVIALVVLSIRILNAPIIELAMLDTARGTLGTGTNELAILQEAWKGSPVRTFSNANELEAWEQEWPNSDGRPAVKIIYDRIPGVITVSGHSQGKAFQKTFLLEKDLATTLQQVSRFVREQTQRQ